jgi:hypothetical protein
MRGAELIVRCQGLHVSSQGAAREQQRMVAQTLGMAEHCLCRGRQRDRLGRRVLHTGRYASEEGAAGAQECPFELYRTWVNDPDKAREQVAAITRTTMGAGACAVQGVPTPE